MKRVMELSKSWSLEGVAQGAGCSYPGGLDLMVGNLGTWKPLADFCHFLLFSAVGITEIVVLGQW